MGQVQVTFTPAGGSKHGINGAASDEAAEDRDEARG